MYATCVPLPLPLLPPLALLTLGQELVHYEVLVALVHVELLHAMCQAVVSARLCSEVQFLCVFSDTKTDPIAFHDPPFPPQVNFTSVSLINAFSQIMLCIYSFIGSVSVSQIEMVMERVLLRLADGRGRREGGEGEEGAEGAAAPG